MIPSILGQVEKNGRNSSKENRRKSCIILRSHTHYEGVIPPNIETLVTKWLMITRANAKTFAFNWYVAFNHRFSYEMNFASLSYSAVFVACYSTCRASGNRVRIKISFDFIHATVKLRQQIAKSFERPAAEAKSQTSNGLWSLRNVLFLAWAARICRDQSSVRLLLATGHIETLQHASRSLASQHRRRPSPKVGDAARWGQLAPYIGTKHSGNVSTVPLHRWTTTVPVRQCAKTWHAVRPPYITWINGQSSSSRWWRSGCWSFFVKDASDSTSHRRAPSAVREVSLQ